jgi:hypothetical protein
MDDDPTRLGIHLSDGVWREPTIHENLLEDAVTLIFYPHRRSDQLHLFLLEVQELATDLVASVLKLSELGKGFPVNRVLRGQPLGVLSAHFDILSIWWSWGQHLHRRQVLNDSFREVTDHSSVKYLCIQLFGYEQKKKLEITLEARIRRCRRVVLA